MFGYGIVTVLLLAFVREVLHGSALVSGWLFTAQGVGGIIGGLLIGRMGPRVPPGRLFAAGLGATGVSSLRCSRCRRCP